MQKKSQKIRSTPLPKLGVMPVSHDTEPPNKSIYSTIELKIGRELHRHILQRHVAPHSKNGKERVHRKGLFESVNLQIAIRVRQNLRGNFRKPGKEDAPAEKHGTWRNISVSSKKTETRLRLILVLKQG